MITTQEGTHLSHDEAFAAAEQLVDKYVSMWVDVCNISSYTADKAGVDAVGAYFIEHAKKLGYEVDVHPEEKSGNAITLIMNPNAKKAPVCISGHMDTVFPKELFGENPTRVEGDTIYGPGVVDCKGGLIVGSLAMEALLRCGYNERPIKMIFQSDEELSSLPSEKRTVAYMAKMAEGCTAFINLDNLANS
jgi:glutamate carboxypeptidase